MRSCHIMRYNKIMLKLASSLLGSRILSVHAGGTIGRLGQPIIQPHNLTVVGFYVESPESDETRVLLAQDIRECNRQGCVVDHEEEITPASELHRHQDLFKINFQLVEKMVQTESKKKLGKVEDYVVNLNGFVVQKIHVKRPAWRSLTSSALVVNRTQIVEVTDQRIIVKDAVVEERQTAAAPVPTN